MFNDLLLWGSMPLRGARIFLCKNKYLEWLAKPSTAPVYGTGITPTIRYKLRYEAI